MPKKGKSVIILGAGRSATSLINYLLDVSEQKAFTVSIGDLETANINARFPKARVFAFNVEAEDRAKDLIKDADLIISMLPAHLHIRIAIICAELGINLLTASYLNDDIKALDRQFKAKNRCCIMELGLDPGLDHMSALKVLNKIKDAGHTLTGFETFTGGLLAENTEAENPWNYKFTWNPRNVVMAGNGTVKFLQEGRYKYIPYHNLFRRTEVIYVPGHGYFEGYANRDSLKYLELYKLQGINTLYRGTLRRPGFCKAWDVFVQLGATCDDYQMESVDGMTHRQFINSFLRFNPHDSVELKLAHYLNLGLESEEMYKLKWLGIFEEEPVGLKKGTPAQILEHILKKKWTLNRTDKDMIVMWHKFNYMDNDRPKEIQAHMVVYGDDQVNTAMSKTVGLPLAICAEMILDQSLEIKGVHIPTLPPIYKPILARLDEMGFEFIERETIS
ncbi:MAG: saccharopine dehydrogenase NADP-binding domain-containing protein [Cyclobacteriaceae bacterium]